jgi:tetratricopeptide (TPR) repeat protein
MCFALLCAGITLLIAVAGCQSGQLKWPPSIREASTRRDLQKADALIAKKDDLQAAQLLEKIVRREPNHAGARARLGRLALASGDYAQAAENFRAALRNQPDSFEYALSLARCLARLAESSMDREKMMEAAARAYCFAQMLDPQGYTATIELAACYREQGAFEKAAAALKDALKHYPDAADLHAQLGEAYHAQNLRDAALGEFRAALILDPDNLAAHNGCGRVNAELARQGGPKGSIARERAIAHFRRSLQVCADQPQVRHTLQELEPYQWKAVTAIETAPE